MRTILLFSCLILSGCIGFQHLTFNPDGSIKSATQVDATMAEGTASAREIVTPNGTRISSVQQNYDATRVPGALIDGVVTVKGLKIAGDNQAITNKYDGKSKLKGTKDPNKIPLDPNLQ